MARILHVVTSPRAEGTPRLVLDWLTVAGHEQGVAFLTVMPDDLLEDFRRTGCWLRIGNAIVPGPGKFWNMAKAAREWTREFKPDLVIVWPTGFSHWIFLGVRTVNRRVALLSHAGNPPAQHWFGRYVMTWICVWLTALCNARMVACSRYVQRLFADLPLVPGARIKFAYNSVRAASFAQRAAVARALDTVRRPFRALMVATLEAHKDHMTLLRAARLLQDRRAGMEIWIVGSGTLEAELKAQATALGVGPTVRFLGSRRDVPELLGQCDLFVFSTTPQEGFGIVLVEALAAGLPVIATAVEPIQEVLEGGRWGTLVPVGDAEALARAIAQATGRVREDREQSAARRDYAFSFSPERMVADYLRLGVLSAGISDGCPRLG